MTSQAGQGIPGLLYEGVLAPEARYDGLNRLCSQLNAGVFHYFSLGGATAPPLESVCNLEQFGLHARHIAEYEEQHAGNDPRMNVTLRTPVGQFMFDHQHVTAKEISRSAVYQDWLIPLGVRHTAAMVVQSDGNARDFLSFMLPRDAKPFSSVDAALIASILPDLARAAKLRNRMAQLSQQMTLGMAVLDRLAQGLVVVDGQCRIHYLNSAAEQWMRVGHGQTLRASQQRLECVSAKSQSRLQQLVASACAQPGGAAGSFELKMTSAAQRLAVSVMPLKADRSTLALRPRPLALVVITSPESASALNPQLVSDMLGLSPTETRLALLLVSGKSIKDFAVIEGCTWHTARTHIKNLMRKSGCHRQLELVQLLQSMHIG